MCVCNAHYNKFTYLLFMTPQELYEQTKNELEVDTAKSRELQEELNKVNINIYANQKILEKFKNVDGIVINE